MGDPRLDTRSTRNFTVMKVFLNYSYYSFHYSVNYFPLFARLNSIESVDFELHKTN